MFKYGFLGTGLFLLLASVASPLATGQTADQRAAIQQRLNSQFQLTKTTADGSDIVTAGSVLVLQKDNLLMCSIDTKVPPTSTYKGGKISFGFGAGLAWNMELGGVNSSDVPQRKFVAGEKFWVKNIDVQDDGVIFQFYSDPYNDVRYYGKLKFPFPKHTMPPPDEMMKIIAEAVTVEGQDNAAKAAPQPAPAAAPASVQQTMAPIPPPPPPPDAPPAEPKKISLGQTKDQVVAIFGEPKRIASLGTKEIYYYPDMKVTFVHGKVSDVQ